MHRIQCCARKTPELMHDVCLQDQLFPSSSSDISLLPADVRLTSCCVAFCLGVFMETQMMDCLPAVRLGIVAQGLLGPDCADALSR